MTAKSELRNKNENDLKMEDVESGLSIRDETDDEFINDIREETDVEALPVLTRDKLVKIFKKNKEFAMMLLWAPLGTFGHFLLFF